MRIQIVGIYPVQADEHCHLVELLVHGEGENLDVGSITQEVVGQPRSNWQVPYLEHVRDPDGQSGGLAPRSPLDVEGKVRIAFFLHCVDPALPLLTPAGDLRLPAPTERPRRLDFIAYEAP